MLWKNFWEFPKSFPGHRERDLQSMEVILKSEIGWNRILPSFPLLCLKELPILASEMKAKSDLRMTSLLWRSRSRWPGKLFENSQKFFHSIQSNLNEYGIHSKITPKFFFGRSNEVADPIQMLETLFFLGSASYIVLHLCISCTSHSKCYFHIKCLRNARKQSAKSLWGFWLFSINIYDAY